MTTISNLWQRIFTGSLFLIIMIGAIIGSFHTFLLLFGVITVLCTYEYLKIISVFSSPNKWVLYIANIAGYCMISLIALIDIDLIPFPIEIVRLIKTYFIYYGQLFIMVIIPILIIVLELFRGKEKPLENIVYTILGFLYILVPFTLLIHISISQPWGYRFEVILAYFIALWIADIFGYVWGKLLGKHKLAPKISKGKTVEGTVGGILTATTISFLFPLLFPGIKFTSFEWVLFAFIIALFAVPSDLSESIIKRQAGVKDSGKILPGHGGILDRFDSVLLTAPIIYIYLKIIPIL